MSLFRKNQHRKKNPSFLLDCSLLLFIEDWILSWEMGVMPEMSHLTSNLALSCLSSAGTAGVQTFGLRPTFPVPLKTMAREAGGLNSVSF